TGLDSNPWFTEQQAGQVARISPSGTIREFAIPTGSAHPSHIVSEPDGNLWCTEAGDTANKSGRITPLGSFAEFSIPIIVSGPDGITCGPDGNLWFTDTNAN